MPIDEKMEEFYPENWDEVREDILLRATYCLDSTDAVLELKKEVPDKAFCEFCGAPNGEKIIRVKESSEWSWGSDAKGRFFDDSGNLVGSGLDRSNDTNGTEIVLTIAHMDQNPTNNEYSNLRALCQRCHLSYDKRPEQISRRRKVKAELLGQQTIGDLGVLDE